MTAKSPKELDLSSVELKNTPSPFNKKYEQKIKK
jgi:hypothetical protein